MTDWAIPQQAKLKYTQLFNIHDRSRSGFLSGLQCRDILLQSGLPRNILAEIWNLSDIDGDGQLTREEFILAMHLTNHVRSGHTLPTELSADLIPPSYRRTRSISATSVHSASSSVASASGTAPSIVGSGTSTLQDDQMSQKSSEAGGMASSVLNSHSFEDKRRENFEKGRAELERRRLKMIEQQTSVLNEQLVACKKQVAEAKAKIDKMRSERDTKAGLITSLEAQLQTVRDRKAYLDHEELSLIAIAKDLNLVNSAHSIELDQQATKAKQESINQMKEKLAQLQKEKEQKAAELTEASQRLEESKKELKSVSDEVGKSYESYREKVAKAKVMRQQFLEENKNKTVDLDSAWDSAPMGFTPGQQQAGATAPTPPPTTAKFESPSPTPFGASDDPWATATTTTSSAIKNNNNNNNNNNATLSNEPFNAFNDAITTNNSGFESARDYSALSGLEPKPGAIGQQSPAANILNDGFDDKNIPELGMAKKKYRALYAFDARNVDELTINPGDIIIGTEVVCEPGWLSGESNGRSGLFPEAYVELLAADAIPGPAALVSGNKNQSLVDQSATSTVSSASNVDVTAEPQVVKYKVIYEFKARNPDELTIEPGDIIVGVEGPHEPGWLMGDANGRKGLFPEAYVEKLVAESAQQPAEQTTEQTTGVLRRGSSSGSLRSKKSRAKKAEVATVIANYRALGQEQLNLEKGQLVSIRRKMDSGWWEGELQIKDNKCQQSRNGRNELGYLIDELISSEWDFVNDLRLCQSAYIFPLSSSFDVSHIFINWNQLIQVHETSLAKLSDHYLNERPMANGNDMTHDRQLNYGFVFETFQNLFNTIIHLYVDYCSRQNESTKHLEVKLASDIRFRQIVNESQRKLRKLLEQQVDHERRHRQSMATNGTNGVDSSQLDSGQHSRALRNSNLPLTSFLIKPMQRITKYSLIFDRILKTISQNVPLKHLENQVEKLKTSAEILCRQVNEACRVKEDDEDNRIKLRWCQNHISQQSSHQQQQNHIIENQLGTDLSLAKGPVGADVSPVGLVSGGRLSASFSGDHSACNASPASIQQQASVETIVFNSRTNCLGPRRLIRAASLFKLKASGRELVAFLFNDLLLLTQIKGGLCLRVRDVFKSERAQQAYYKPYKRPILLEDLQMVAFDEEQVANVTCSSINSSNISEHEDQIMSFLDRYNGISYNLMAMDSSDRNEWIRELNERCQEAREARAVHRSSARCLRPVRRLNSGECLGRLFVTVVELDRLALGQCASSSPQLWPATCESHQQHLGAPWERKLSFSAHQPYSMQPVQNVCLKLQLRRYRRTYGPHDEDSREVIPLSDEFRTRTISTQQFALETSIRSPGAFMDNNGQCQVLDSSKNGGGGPRSNSGQMIRLEDDCTQFLIPSKLIGLDFVDYLDLELVGDSRFRETHLLARKRINIDQLIGRDTNQPTDATPVAKTIASTPTQSMRASRIWHPIQPNRPVEKLFRLKSLPMVSIDNKSQRSSYTPSNDQFNAPNNLPKLAVRLRLHLQLFGDNLNS